MREKTKLPLENLPTTVLQGVGAKFAETLLKLGIQNVQDLLFHLPSRYVDRTRVRQIASLSANDMALIEANVLSAQISFGKRRSLQVKIEDDSGVINLRFFHFNSSQKNSFEQGRKVRVFGELRPGASGLEMYHPEYDFVEDDTQRSENESTLTPIYPLTDGVSQPRLRNLAMQALSLLQTQALEEWLPLEVNAHFGVNSLTEALCFIHKPPHDTNQQELLDGLHPSQQRLAFEELLAHFLVRQNIREQAKASEAPIITAQAEPLEKFLSTLPFQPTNAQARVYKEISEDLNKSHAMLRMVQGDVGSGKTLVAAMAAFNTVKAGFQVALVAPTEILAEQHLKSFKQWFDSLEIRCDWLAGKHKASAKTACYEKLRSHMIDIVIGTHALFQDQVQFARLGLVIIDEQHRFGVHQRLSLRDKSAIGLAPHQLVMTATPIPRTLAMTSYAELDFSIIDELPPGRSPVQTAVVSQKRRPEVIARIFEACKEGRQVYWVCPLIEESETLSAANAEQTYKDLQESLSDVEVSLIHGRLKPQDKEARMNAFKAKEAQVLVATTVIEVGVDVPNASVMIIENPERLGLAQLHQLRGRVGRGSAQSSCILLYGDKLSHAGRQRLQVLRDTNDGFEIAEKDLEMRGPGEFLGTKQAGDMLYRIADHERDAHLFDLVHQVGAELLRAQPEHAEALISRWFEHRKEYALA